MKIKHLYIILLSIGYLSGGIIYLLLLYRSNSHKTSDIKINFEGKSISAVSEMYEEAQLEIKKKKN